MAWWDAEWQKRGRWALRDTLLDLLNDDEESDPPGKWCMLSEDFPLLGKWLQDHLLDSLKKALSRNGIKLDMDGLMCPVMPAKERKGKDEDDDPEALHKLLLERLTARKIEV